MLAQHVARAGHPVCPDWGKLAEPRTWASSSEGGEISGAVLPIGHSKSALVAAVALAQERVLTSTGSQNACIHSEGSGGLGGGQDGLPEHGPISSRLQGACRGQQATAGGGAGYVRCTLMAPTRWALQTYYKQIPLLTLMGLLATCP